MSPAVVLRPVQADDDAFLRRVYASARADELALVPWPEEAKAAFLDQQFDAQRMHYLAYAPGATYQVVQVNGEPAGRLYVDRGEHEVRVMDIALLPEFRGAGIGTELLQALMHEAAASGRRVGLHVEKFNRALHWYERLGFKVVDDAGVYWFLLWQPPATPAQGRLHGATASS